MLEALRTRGVDQGAAIKGPATNLTLGSSFVALVAAAATLFNDTYKEIFPGEVDNHIKSAVLIAVIAAWAVIAVADLLARAIASSPRDLTHVAPAPKGWEASIIKSGKDDSGYMVVAMRFTSADSLEYLIVKDGEQPIWRPQGELSVKPPD